MLYKGYIETRGKQPCEKLKNRTKWKTLEEVRNLNGYAGVLEKDTIFVDVDDPEQSEILMNIVEEYQLDCRVYCTKRGKHFVFKNHSISRNRTHVQLRLGARGVQPAARPQTIQRFDREHDADLLL